MPPNSHQELQMAERKYERCLKCKVEILFCNNEIEDGWCYKCQDKAIAHSNERREWNYYHPEGK